MSLLRYMLNDLRPLVRMLDEPLAPSRLPTTSSFLSSPTFSPLFRDSFFQELRQPTLDVHEDKDGKAYLVEAELPGVRKEDVEVRIAEGGRGLTIEGKVSRRSGFGQQAQPAEGSTANASATPAEGATSDSTAVTKTSDNANAVQPYQGWQTYESTFSRYVGFPKPVNPEGVTAKLENGILSLRVPQAEERGSVRVDVQ